MEAVTEETIHEACHRQATTFGFVEERGDEGTRDDRLITGSLCHQRFMPRGRGLLQASGKGEPFGRFWKGRVELQGWFEV